MAIMQVDERHRITLPGNIIEKYGERFVVIEIKGNILLKPLPKDPIKALQKEGEKLKGLSIKQIRKIAYEEALKEAGKSH